jgi:hypothetical protein
LKSLDFKRGFWTEKIRDNSLALKEKITNPIENFKLDVAGSIPVATSQSPAKLITSRW